MRGKRSVRVVWWNARCAGSRRRTIVCRRHDDARRQPNDRIRDPATTCRPVEPCSTRQRPQPRHDSVITGVRDNNFVFFIILHFYLRSARLRLCYDLERCFRWTSKTLFRRAFRRRGPKISTDREVSTCVFRWPRSLANGYYMFEGSSAVHRRRKHGNGENKAWRAASQRARRRSRVSWFHSSKSKFSYLESMGCYCVVCLLKLSSSNKLSWCLIVLIDNYYLFFKFLFCLSSCAVIQTDVTGGSAWGFLENSW